MNSPKTAILLAIILLISLTGKAQFTLTGEYRPRTELSKG